jgi:hypothetical protein
VYVCIRIMREAHAHTWIPATGLHDLLSMFGAYTKSFESASGLALATLASTSAGGAWLQCMIYFARLDLLICKRRSTLHSISVTACLHCASRRQQPDNEVKAFSSAALRALEISDRMQDVRLHQPPGAACSYQAGLTHATVHVQRAYARPWMTKSDPTRWGETGNSPSLTCRLCKAVKIVVLHEAPATRTHAQGGFVNRVETCVNSSSNLVPQT